ncbi:TetR/AcrR family transcriptional regulator C-terminal domain-containing protein [Novosphingobium jiangmenense]|uniref:TetR/AcrR family transcriptional regulator C-terminal domain-containing protein n=1 Tax=Novosphingobium jiangmenense TaxID=2791981 RepID=A0ABS0HBC8_9SPHN|nr:TetR/AcrR family transcriptional regulator C-terminal domain-containing protein [Novosphingobium jiangmenense]MBF9149588.1 TetR/AcrR family transcriptional regulator C-terminal domain-containing protein [Novosphingobium jiangmenense]
MNRKTSEPEKKATLTRDAIVDAGLALLDQIGLDKFTTRRLGDYLGVEGPALYRHFPSKAVLLDHMAAAILLPVLRQPHPGEPWDEWLKAIAQCSYEAVLKYRDGARLVAASLPTEPRDLLSKPLREAGFSEEHAVYGAKLITRFMVGWQLHEDSERHRSDRPSETYDHEEAFHFALDALINGLRLVLARTMTQRIESLGAR